MTEVQILYEGPDTKKKNRKTIFVCVWSKIFKAEKKFCELTHGKRSELRIFRKRKTRTDYSIHDLI